MYDLRYAEEQEAKYQAALECVAVKGKIILDVGCGTGLLFHHMAEKSELLVGLDLAKIPLFHAHERAKRFRNVHVVQGDADHLPFRIGFFEAVFAFTVLQNMPTPSDVLTEIRQAATPNACVVVTVLRKTISSEALAELLTTVGLYPACIINRDFLKCHVSINFLDNKHVVKSPFSGKLSLQES